MSKSVAMLRWAPLHKMAVDEATANFPKEASIARCGEHRDNGNAYHGKGEPDERAYYSPI